MELPSDVSAVQRQDYLLVGSFKFLYAVFCCDPRNEYKEKRQANTYKRKDNTILFYEKRSSNCHQTAKYEGYREGRLVGRSYLFRLLNSKCGIILSSNCKPQERRAVF